MKAVRNIAIIALAAAAVDFLPAGGAVANAVLTALTAGFLAAMGWFVYRLHQDNQLTIATLGDARRGVLYGALGVIALLIAGTSKFFDTSLGTVIWIGILALALLAIFRVWTDAQRYT